MAVSLQKRKNKSINHIKITTMETKIQLSFEKSTLENLLRRTASSRAELIMYSGILYHAVKKSCPTILDEVYGKPVPVTKRDAVSSLNVIKGYLKDGIVKSGSDYVRTVYDMTKKGLLPESLLGGLTCDMYEWLVEDTITELEETEVMLDEVCNDDDTIVDEAFDSIRA